MNKKQKLSILIFCGVDQDPAVPGIIIEQIDKLIKENIKPLVLTNIETKKELQENTALTKKFLSGSIYGKSSKAVIEKFIQDFGIGYHKLLNPNAEHDLAKAIISQKENDGGTVYWFANDSTNIVKDIKSHVKNLIEYPNRKAKIALYNIIEQYGLPLISSNNFISYIDVIRETRENQLIVCYTNLGSSGDFAELALQHLDSEYFDLEIFSLRLISLYGLLFIDPNTEAVLKEQTLTAYRIENDKAKDLANNYSNFQTKYIVVEENSNGQLYSQDVAKFIQMAMDNLK